MRHINRTPFKTLLDGPWYVYTSMLIYLYTSTQLNLHPYTCILFCTHAYAHILIYSYTRTPVLTHTCIHTHTHTQEFTDLHKKSLLADLFKYGEMAHSFLEEKSQALKYFKTHYKREPHNIRELARFSLEQLPKAIDKENEQRMQV